MLKGFGREANEGAFSSVGVGSARMPSVEISIHAFLEGGLGKATGGALEFFAHLFEQIGADPLEGRFEEALLDVMEDGVEIGGTRHDIDLEPFFVEADAITRLSGGEEIAGGIFGEVESMGEQMSEKASASAFAARIGRASRDKGNP